MNEGRTYFAMVDEIVGMAKARCDGLKPRSLPLLGVDRAKSESPLCRHLPAKENGCGGGQKPRQGWWSPGGKRIDGTQLDRCYGDGLEPSQLHLMSPSP